MPLPPLVRQLAEAKLDTYSARRIPARLRDEMRLEHKVRGNSITLIERRPPWRGGGAWSSSPIAQLRYSADDGAWTLHCCDRNRRWHVYEFAEPTADLDELVDAIDLDRTGIFWG